MINKDTSLIKTRQNFPTSFIKIKIFYVFLNYFFQCMICLLICRNMFFFKLMKFLVVFPSTIFHFLLFVCCVFLLHLCPFGLAFHCLDYSGINARFSQNKHSNPQNNTHLRRYNPPLVKTK